MRRGDRCCVECALTLEHTPHGWVQRASFVHPDLHDELVDELISLESPFACAGAGGASVFTFLLLGDQNAGKSTFLHAFSHAGSAQWLELGSYLPIVSASFLNASLGAGAPPMDEPPFLDTDIGRASLLLTLEDFAFFVEEFELAAVDVHALAAQRVAHVAVQLVEVGGDHLDRLMAHAARRDADEQAEDAGGWDAVYRRSRQLLGASRKSAYFLNATALLRPEARFAGAAGRLLLVEAEVRRLAARLAYLRGVLPPGQQVVFYLSRLPPTRAGRFDEASAEAAVAALLPAAAHKPVLAEAARRQAAAAAPPPRSADAHRELHPEIDLHAPPPPHAAVRRAAAPPRDWQACAAGVRSRRAQRACRPRLCRSRRRPPRRSCSVPCCPLSSARSRPRAAAARAAAARCG